MDERACRVIKSPEIDQLAAALVAAQSEFEVVAKEAENPFFKSRYADLPSVVKAAAPVLAKHDLCVTQTIGADTLTTLLVHKSGQYLGDMAVLHFTKDDAQGVGSAVTYFRRYAYMAILGLVADVDDDGNAASTPQPAAERPTTRRAAPTSTRPAQNMEDF
jgi:ERF superfamily